MRHQLEDGAVDLPMLVPEERGCGQQFRSDGVHAVVEKQASEQRLFRLVRVRWLLIASRSLARLAIGLHFSSSISANVDAGLRDAVAVMASVSAFMINGRDPRSTLASFSEITNRPRAVIE